jgi:leader peptidase (prepilin peptidase)/N-methyltransferase
VSWEIIALFAISGLGVGLAGRRVLHAADAAVPVWSCEALSVLLWSAVGWWWLSGSMPGWWLPVPLAVTTFAAPLLLSDLRQLRLPNVLTLPAYPVLGTAIGVAAWHGGFALGLRAGLGALAFGAAHVAVHWLRPGALGAGDVKLAGSMGAVLGAVGWAALVLAAFAAAVITGVLSAFSLMSVNFGCRRERCWRDGVPYGPGLLVVTWAIALVPGAEWP